MGRENWQMIRDRISGQIAGGHLLPGQQLPTESQLCEMFGAGRHSVRRAVAALSLEGKLRVEQGRGTFVQAAPLIRYNIGRRTRFRRNLLEQGVSPSGEQIGAEIVAASAPVASALGLSEGAMVHRLLRRGLADGLPLSLGLSYHCARRFPDLAVQRQAGRSITDIYRDHGIADYFRKSTTVFARRAEAHEAELLMQHPDQPVLVLQKIDVDARGTAIGYSEAIWAGERVQFTFDSLDENSASPEGTADA